MFRPPINCHREPAAAFRYKRYQIDESRHRSNTEGAYKRDDCKRRTVVRCESYERQRMQVAVSVKRFRIYGGSL